MQSSASDYLEKKRAQKEAQQKGQDLAAALMQSSAADYLARKRASSAGLEAANGGESAAEAAASSADGAPSPAPSSSGTSPARQKKKGVLSRLSRRFGRRPR
eukprot:1007085-Prymnesium_polylepis.1